MFETITNEKLVYKFVNKEGKDVKINYIWTINDKKVIDKLVEKVLVLAEKDAYQTREELINRGLINTNKGLVLDGFAELDKEFGFTKTETSEDEDCPL